MYRISKVLMGLLVIMAATGLLCQPVLAADDDGPTYSNGQVISTDGSQDVVGLCGSSDDGGDGGEGDPDDFPEGMVIAEGASNSADYGLTFEEFLFWMLQIMSQP
jgi:hypothetical protein